MSYIVIVSPEVKKTLKKWKKSNPKLLPKVADMLHELAEHPREGLGHPEALKG